MKKGLVNIRYPDVRGQCDDDCLGLGLYMVSKQTVFIVLQRIGRKTITYENSFPTKKREFISEIKIKHVDVLVKRYTLNLGISRKELIQVS